MAGVDGMKTNVAHTSIDTYHALKAEGRLSTRQAQVLAAIEPNKDYSLQELVALTGLPVNVISGRCHELRNQKRLELGKTRTCTRTGRTVRPVKLPQGQGDLF